MFTQEDITNTRNVNGSLVGTGASGRLAVFCPSVAAFIDLIETEFPEPLRGNSSITKKEEDYDFYQFDTWNEMMRLFKEDPSSLVQFEEIDYDLVDFYNVGNEIVYDVTGDFIDIGLFVDGEPEHFGNVVYGNPRGIFAKIFINISVPFYVTSQVLWHKGQRLIGLVDWLEARNIRCEIVTIHSNECDLVEVVVKNTDEILDLSTLAIACTSDYHRRLCFRIAENSETFRWGYGSGASKMKVSSDGVTVALNQFSKKEQVDDFFTAAINKLGSEINFAESQMMLESTALF